MKRWWCDKLWATALLLLACAPVSAQQKIAVATTSTSEAAALFVAIEEGFFSRRGLDLEAKLVALNPNIPASVVSGSMQIGLPTPTVLGQAVDNGLDLVVVSGGSVISGQHRSAALIARPDSSVGSARDLVGKTVAVPGLNALLHVAVQIWLEKQGVPARSVRFVEAPIPQVGDLLKAGRIDAAVGVDPFLSRFSEQGVSKVVAWFLSEIAPGQQTMYYVSTRDWATKNPKAIQDFRAGLDEAAAFIDSNPGRARDHLNKYMKLPAEVAKTIALPSTSTKLTSEQFAFWNVTMHKLGLISVVPDMTRFVIP